MNILSFLVPTINLLFVGLVKNNMNFKQNLYLFIPNLLKIKILSFFFILFFSSANAQQANFFSRSEFGVSIGQMYYIGDLNKFKPFYKSNWAGGLMYRYNLHSRLSLRFNYLQGKVEAYDSDAKNPVTINRNLSFQSPIKEVAGGVEFHYFPFQFGQKKNSGTAYLLAQLGVFYMSPSVVINGETIDLQVLGTEAQGTDINSSRKYSKFQLCVPLGLGVKASLGKNVTFNFDLALRKTFTDYIDDVKAFSYADPAIIASEYGSLAADLSNQSFVDDRYAVRGNPTTKDWYVYCGGMVTIRLGSGNKCPVLR